MAQDIYQSEYSSTDWDLAIGKILRGESEAAAALAEYWAKEAERYAGGGYSRPNLLDNWYFVDPINQRQAVAFEGRYGADRWIGTSVKIEKGGFSFSPGGNIVQLLEMGESIRGKTVSLSILFSDNTLSHGVFIYADGPSETVSFEDSRVAIGLLQDLLGIRITTKIRATAVAAKLELGPTQTLAHQEAGKWVLNDPPPNKAVELMKCQRYYEKITNIGTSVTENPSGYFRFWVPFKTVKAKSKPSAKVISVNGVDGKISIFDGSIWKDVPAIAIQNEDGVIVEATDGLLVNAAIMFSIEGSADL